MQNEEATSFHYVHYSRAKEELTDLVLAKRVCALVGGMCVCVWVCVSDRLQSDIQDLTLKICLPGRIITRSSDIRDPTLKK